MRKPSSTIRRRTTFFSAERNASPACLAIALLVEVAGPLDDAATASCLRVASRLVLALLAEVGLAVDVLDRGRRRRRPPRRPRRCGREQRELARVADPDLVDERLLRLAQLADDRLDVLDRLADDLLGRGGAPMSTLTHASGVASASIIRIATSPSSSTRPEMTMLNTASSSSSSNEGKATQDPSRSIA
jgi:hypothetical protein